MKGIKACAKGETTPANTEAIFVENTRRHFLRVNIIEKAQSSTLLRLRVLRPLCPHGSSHHSSLDEYDRSLRPPRRLCEWCRLRPTDRCRPPPPACEHVRGSGEGGQGRGRGAARTHTMAVSIRRTTLDFKRFERYESISFFPSTPQPTTTTTTTTVIPSTNINNSNLPLASPGSS